MINIIKLKKKIKSDMKVAGLTYLFDNIWVILIMISIVTIFFICFDKYTNIKHERIKDGFDVSKLGIISSRIGFFAIAFISLLCMFVITYIV